MNDPLITEIDIAISNINGAIFAALKEKDDDYFRTFALTYESDSFTYGISFCGFPIWTSEEDERKYDEANDRHEPMEGFLRRRIKEIVAKGAEMAANLHD